MTSIEGPNSPSGSRRTRKFSALKIKLSFYLKRFIIIDGFGLKLTEDRLALDKSVFLVRHPLAG